MVGENDDEKIYEAPHGAGHRKIK
jgi:hypothetical protein